MIVYRHTIDADGGSEFFRTKAEALAAFRASEAAGLRGRVDQLNVPTSHDGIVWVLNVCLCHPDHWQGTLIVRNTDKAPPRVKETA